MSSSGGEGAQPKISDRDIHSPIADGKRDDLNPEQPDKHDLRPGEKASQERATSPVSVPAERSDRDQPLSAPNMAGEGVGRDDEVGAKDVEVDVSASPSDPLAKAILDAIDTGVPAAVDAALAETDRDEGVVGALTGMSSRGMPLIAHAARSGNVEIFVAVNTSVTKHLSLEQARKTYTITAENGQGSLLVAAADGESDAVFSKVVRLLEGEVLQTIAESWRYGSETVVNAARDGGRETFKAVTKILDANLTPEQAMEEITPNAAEEPTTFTAAVQRGNRHIVSAWAEVLLAKLPRSMVIEASTTTFEACLHNLRSCPDTMSALVALGANITASSLISFKPDVTLEELKTCFFGGISSAENPFTPGMALSVAVETAVRKLPERERRTLSDFQEKLDELLLEVLERLPQSIQRLPGGIGGCVALFEPDTVDMRGFDGRVGMGVREAEAVGVRGAERRGPLKLALQERQLTEAICVSPLMFEYLSHKFISGLPMPGDSEHHITSTYDYYQGGGTFYGDGMVAESDLGRLMQGLRLTSHGSLDRPRDWEKLLSSTIYPGAQFVAAGVVTKPMAYYKVPAIRMFLDFVVHLFMLTLYTLVVLEGDDGSVSTTEIVLTFHVTAEIVSELGEMYANFHEWVKDEWNWLQSISLVLLAGALYYRIADSNGVSGRALFALSAPLVFSRVLFYGQVLRRQGLVVQAITIMIGELLQFGLVLGVVMMGFTVAFFAIFEEERSYGDVWLDVFKAMLGEVGIFDDFFDGFYGNVAKFLLVVYLLFMTIMLLNLLIAILSTEHAKIEQGQDRAFRVSKVRIIKFFSRVVDNDSQPPPFNLIQLALVLPFLAVDRVCRTSTHEKVKRMVGELVFWLTVGPLSVLAAWGLCIASAPNAVLARWRGNVDSQVRGSSSVRFVLFSAAAVFFRLFIAPVVLVALWVQAGVVECFHSAKDVKMSLLRGERGGGAAEISPGSYPHRHNDRGEGEGRVEGAPSHHDDPRQSGEMSPDNYDGLKQHQHDKSKAVSVAEMLRRSHGDQKSVREIWTYLDNLASSDGLHHNRSDKDSPATVDNLNRMRTQIQSASERRGDAVLAHLQSIDATVKTGVQEVGQKVNNRVVALDRRVDERFNRLEGKMAAIIEELLRSRELDDRSALPRKFLED